MQRQRKADIFLGTVVGLFGLSTMGSAIAQYEEDPRSAAPSELRQWLGGKQFVHYGDGLETVVSFCSDGRFVQTLKSSTSSRNTGYDFSYAGQDSTIGNWRAMGGLRGGTLWLTDPTGMESGELQLQFQLGEAGDTARLGPYVARVHGSNQHCH
ncbi:MAG: hypothetical protein AAFX52_08805 [Pseudomonadota bacterium]